jgi:hypothetical protein
MPRYFGHFDEAILFAVESLKHSGAKVDAGRWQGVVTIGKPDLQTKEILDLNLSINLDRGSWYDPGTVGMDYVTEVAEEIKPNLPWADEHFGERVGGVAANPDPSLPLWPWWRGQDKETMVDGKFTHTYSERFWPGDLAGLRFSYGDYSDVIDLLAREPYTRQAYLPIFFPEDTGARHGGRIPCSLGYHFLFRAGLLHCWYDIRSCDAVRHFRDDLYLAVRLVAHTLTSLFELAAQSRGDEAWLETSPGVLYFKAHSFHVHMGDYHHIV